MNQWKTFISLLLSSSVGIQKRDIYRIDCVETDEIETKMHVLQWKPFLCSFRISIISNICELCSALIVPDISVDF